METIYMSCQILFFGKNKKIISKCRLSNIYPVLSVNFLIVYCLRYLDVALKHVERLDDQRLVNSVIVILERLSPPPPPLSLSLSLSLSLACLMIWDSDWSVYSIISMARTRMARLPNSFFSPYKILPVVQENKYLGIFFSYFIMVLYVVCTH